MAQTPKGGSGSRKRRPPATTPEAREQQLISLAFDVAEEQMLNRTATPTVIVHYLKLGTLREQMEREKLQGQNDLLRAQVERLSTSSQNDGDARAALNAFRGYRGEDVEMMDED